MVNDIQREVDTMGWRGHKSKIDVGMIFKKMYCQHCGTKLTIKKNTRLVNKGDKDFSNSMPGMRGTPIGMTSYYESSYTYLCPNCHSENTYAEQCTVEKKQKQLKKRILSEND